MGCREWVRGGYKAATRKGANVKSKDEDGLTPLWKAVEGARGDYEVTAQEERQETSKLKTAKKALPIISSSSRTLASVKYGKDV
jgi:hypothetical protein